MKYNVLLKLEMYFKQKKLNAHIEKIIQNDNYIIIEIKLNDISKLRKWNSMLERELNYLLKVKTKLELNNSEISLIIKKNANLGTPKIQGIGNHSYLACTQRPLFFGENLHGKNISVEMAKSPHVLIAGATGSGKSSTINALFDMEVATVGVGVEAETDDITKYDLENLTIWDTPGLGDGKKADQKYKDMLIHKLNEKDKNGNVMPGFSDFNVWLRQE